MSLSRDLKAIKSQLFTIAEHYAGRPKSHGRSNKGQRRTHVCPGCSNDTFKALVYDDADPPGSGFAGCSNDSCPVPAKRDVVGLVIHFEGLFGGQALPLAISRAHDILGLQPSTGDPTRPTVSSWTSQMPPSNINDGTDNPAPEPSALHQRQDDTIPTTPEQSSLDPGSTDPFTHDHDPIMDQRTSQPPTGGDPTPAKRSAAPSHDTSDYHNTADEDPEGDLQSSTQLPEQIQERPPQASPRRPLDPITPHADPDPIAPDPMDKAAIVKNLDLRDEVYTTVLGRAPRDRILTQFLLSVGVSPEVIRSQRIGISYASDSHELLNHLTTVHGVATLVKVPGFGVDTAGHATTELSSADVALIPFHDAAGRVVALETLSISTPDPSITQQDHSIHQNPHHRLLGGGKTNRDDSLGGVDHLWLPGPATTVDAITDDLLEALRAVSAGASVGAVRGPESAAVGPRPEPLAPDFAGRRVLWIPSPDPRSREASPHNARTILEASNAQPLILSNPPQGEDFEGIGTYLLSLTDDQKKPAFDALFNDTRSKPLPPSSGALDPDNDQASNAPSKPTDPEAGTYQPLYPAYRKRARRAPRQPERSRLPIKAEWAAGAATTLLIVAVALPILRNIVAPLLSFVTSTLADSSPEPPVPPPDEGFGVPSDSSANSKPTSENVPSLAESGSFLPWLLGRLLAPVSSYLEGPLAALTTVLGKAADPSTALSSWWSFFGILVVPLLLGMAATYRLRKLRLERLRLSRGTITRMRVARHMLRLNKEEKRLFPWTTPKQHPKPKTHPKQLPAANPEHDTRHETKEDA